MNALNYMTYEIQKMQIEHSRLASQFRNELIELQTRKTAAESANVQGILISEKLLEATLDSDFLATKS
jgi:hypothetical protein